MKKCWLDRSGATIIEFALVAPVFFLLLLGIIEFGMIGFSQVAIESAVAATAREASIGKVGASGTVGNHGDRVDYVRKHIKTKLKGLINLDNLVITANTVAGGGVTAKPDICMTNPPKVGGPCPKGTLWEDVNGNGVYDSAVTPMSMGNAGDLVEVKVYYPWKIQFPILNQFFGENGVFMVSTATIIKNEPF